MWDDNQLSEDQLVELWRLNRFAEMGFDGMAIATLLEWDLDTHVVEDLLYRNGKRTPCTHEQALTILRPLEPALA